MVVVLPDSASGLRDLQEIFPVGAFGPENAYVADVLQKTFVEVDEDGHTGAILFLGQITTP